MNIKLATSNFLYQFVDLFPDHDVSVVNNEDTAADLVIFTGGEDVNPRLYSSGDELRDAEKLCHWNDSRDAAEKKVFSDIMSGKIETKRILGVCRGLQFINVMLGGTLFPDLQKMERSHKMIHGIEHVYPHILASIQYVNSMHHQAVATLGSLYMGGNYRRGFAAKITSVEPTTHIVESAMWTETMRTAAEYYLEPRQNKSRKPTLSIIGVQFHPEFFPKVETGKLMSASKFSKIIEEWIPV